MDAPDGRGPGAAVAGPVPGRRLVPDGVAVPESAVSALVIVPPGLQAQSIMVQ
jgi:hypothetical protein